MHCKQFLVILLLILSASCGSKTEEEQTFTLSAESKPAPADEGVRLYETKCMPCHGADGTAGIGNAANLKQSSLDSSSIVYVMINGKGAMPPFKDQLDEGALQKLAAYVRTLRK